MSLHRTLITAFFAVTTLMGTASWAAEHHAIVFVWDGLRPDSITPEDTPNLYALQQAGVRFANNHATYPTFTMMNAASFATGGYPATTGFYGNTEWITPVEGWSGTERITSRHTPTPPSGKDAFGTPVDFAQPVFTEDYAILQAIDRYYDGELLLVGTLFQAAQNAGLTTAAVGKSGAAFLQDYKQGGIILDERFVWPLSLAQELQLQGYPLPKPTPNAYTSRTLMLSPGNGDPTAQAPTIRLSDGASVDPTAQPPADSPSALPLADPGRNGAPPNNANAYLMQLFTDYILPQKRPDLSLIWFRNPDSTEHAYGVGTAMYRNALKSQDLLLGRLLAALDKLGWRTTTDVIVVSDHGHSHVSGPTDLFPLRAIVADPQNPGKNTVGAPDPKGYSVSGDVRTADLMRRAGFAHVYDGSGCLYDPVLSGIQADGTPLYPTQVDDDGSACGTPGTRYTTAAAKVPHGALPADSIVIAANGGSEYLYLPAHDPVLMQRAVDFLQRYAQYGAIFVNDAIYGSLPPGTLSMRTIRTEQTDPSQLSRSPDIIYSFAFDPEARIQGFAGTEYESMSSLDRGMHGSFGRTDVHNTLIAVGPSFRQGMVDELPSGNVDVAPTLATLFQLELPQADGRPLREALTPAAGGLDAQSFRVHSQTIEAGTRTGLTFVSPLDPNGNKTDDRYPQGRYTMTLHVTDLSSRQQTWRYFDEATVVRQ